MKEKRSIITMDGQGNIALPTDTVSIAMTEWELCELFGVIAPTIRAGIKALCKSGVLREYETKHTIKLSDKRSMEVYSLEAIIALASASTHSERNRFAEPYLKDCTCEKKKQASSFR